MTPGGLPHIKTCIAMKKEYTAPAMSTIETETRSLIAASEIPVEKDETNSSDRSRRVVSGLWHNNLSDK